MHPEDVQASLEVQEEQMEETMLTEQVQLEAREVRAHGSFYTDAMEVQKS